MAKVINNLKNTNEEIILEYGDLISIDDELYIFAAISEDKNKVMAIDGKSYFGYETYPDDTPLSEIIKNSELEYTWKVFKSSSIRISVDLI